MPEIALTVDGKEVRVDAGSTVLQAAQQAGIPIPTLCHDPDLEPFGGCRLCAVKIKGMRGLPLACFTEAAENMEVTSEDDEILSARRMVMRLLLVDHPSDCLACPANLECELQDLAYELGVRHHGMIPLERQATVDDSSPVFLWDMNRCVVCARCVRTCEEIVGLGAIHLVGRGHDTEVAPFLGDLIVSSVCESCGECVVHCPTGALSFREVPVMAEREVATICPYCGTGCGIVVGVRRGKVVGVTGDRESPVNRGNLCVKGRFGSYQFVHDPERLTTPLIRRNGELEEASWDDALDLVAKKFDERRGEEFAAFASAKVANEDNYLLQKFTRAVAGSNNIDHCARLCHASTVTGLGEAFGSGAMTNPIADFDRSEVILVTGSNTTESHPIVANQIRRAVRRGVKLIMFDPRQIPLTSLATIWCRPRPGTDVAWINGLMHVIIKERLADMDFVRTRTEGFEALRNSVKKYDPEIVAEITGIPVEDIIAAARLYAGGEPASIAYAMGITQHVTGTDNVKSLANLAMLCGNVGVPGGGLNPLRGQNNVQGACDMGALPNVFPGYQSVDDDAVRQKFERAWGVDLPAEPGLTLTEITHACREGRIRALYLMGENPMLSEPDTAHVEAALKATDFLVVQDIFLTETARLADVVLPAASYVEREGTVTNTERRVQRMHQVIEPLEGTRPDWQIICDLSTRLGYPMKYASIAEVMGEIASLTPSYGGISFRRLDAGEELCWPCPAEDHPGTPVLHSERFTRGLGKFHPVEHLPADELPDGAYPLLLTTGRLLEQYHTGTMSRKSKSLNTLAPGPFVEVNPRDAERMGIQDGERAKVISRRGEIELAAKVNGGVDQGVIFIPFHFFEAAANVLTNPAMDPVANIPEFKVCAARVEKVA